MSPLALGLIIGAGSGAKLSARLGTTKFVAAGLAGLATAPGWRRSLWTPDLAYWPLGLWFFGLALSMGWIMGPATDSVMGAVSDDKAGVASAMNDVTRQVAGALGVAVVGSLVTSLYSSRVEDCDGRPAAGVGSDRVRLHRRRGRGCRADARRCGASLAQAASVAYTDALGLGLLAAAAASFVGVALVLRFLPARHRPTQTASVVRVAAVERMAA